VATGSGKGKQTRKNQGKESYKVGVEYSII